MDGQQLVSTVREEEATAVSRLGSDKYLIAATGANLATGAVLRTVASSAGNARDTFRAWAGEEVGDAASAFQTAAETEGDHYDRVVAVIPDAETESAVDETEPVVGAVQRALTASEGTVERIAAGLVGRPLVAGRTRLQVVNFFVNEGDRERADLARDLRSDADEQLDAGQSLLDSVCDGDDDWERAHRAAGRVVADAYDEYATALESMGVDPKPVC